jgi:hypothetical protein
MTEHQAALIAALKSDESSVLPVRTSRGTEIGHLMPVTVKCSDDPGVIERICRWREQHKGAFLTVAGPAPENTRRYLEDVALPDPARALFLIVDLVLVRMKLDEPAFRRRYSPATQSMPS